MNNSHNKFFLLIFLGFLIACNEKGDSVVDGELYRFNVENQLNKPVASAAVTVDLTQFNLQPGHCSLVLSLVAPNYSEASGELSNQKELFQQAATGLEIKDDLDRREIPSQCDDLSGDGNSDVLFFLTDFEAGQILNFELKIVAEKPEYQKRTQAFLKVQSGGNFVNGIYEGGSEMEEVETLDIPNEQVQGSGWAYMEGPVWESDLVGYRFYLDTRNRVDIFGKSMPDLVLDTISVNYHEIHPWGTDVLVVGSSLGLGSLAAMKKGEVRTIDNWTSRKFEVPVNGPLRSIIRMTYEDWDVFGHLVSVVSEIEIHAANRYTEHRVSLSGDVDELILATGIVKHANAEKITIGDAHYSTFGWTSGDQADQGHGLDMGVVIPMEYQPEYLEDDANTHLFAFRTVDGKAVYRYTSAWELDHNVVDDFHTHILETAGLFTQPPKVKVEL